MEGFSVGYLAKGLLKIGFATGVMIIFLLLGKPFMAPWLDGNLGQKLVSTLSLIGAAAGVYAATLYMAGLPELTEIIGKIRVRLGR